MSRADGILDLVVKAAPYRDIFSGVKPEEYRGSQTTEKCFIIELGEVIG